MERTCIIVGAGEYGGEKIARRDGDMLIAADAGYLLCQRLGLAPDQVVGDFDSMGFVPERPGVTRLPVEKDDTDTLRALRIGASMGYRRFEIHAGTGGRVDHTIANIQCLIWLAERGLRGFGVETQGLVLTQTLHAEIVPTVLEGLPAAAAALARVVDLPTGGFPLKANRYERD